jgi:hypothetical protein
LDYIIFGIGSSATLVLAGWLLRDWGPRLSDRGPAEDEILSASALVTRMAWARFCAACGMALLICGVMIMLVTLGAALLAPSDRAATIAVVSMFALAALLMLIWTGLYLRQFGASGVIRPREKPVKVEPAETPVPVTAIGPTILPKTDAIDPPAPTFRRDPGDTTESEPAVAEGAPDAEPVTGTAIHDEPETSPTEGVIAELAGEADTPDTKKLSPSDPLVTAAMDIQPEASIEDAVLSEVLGPDHDDSAEADHESESEPGESGTEPADDATGSTVPSQDLALSQLRRRRLSRLSNPSDRE